MQISRRKLLLGAALSCAVVPEAEAWFPHGQIGLPNHARQVIDGDSISAATAFNSWWVWGSLLSGAKLYIPPGGKTAVGGSTTANVISRLSTDEAFSPRFYSIMIGINNGGAVTPDLETIYAGMIGAGAVVNAIPILKAAAGRTADQLAANVYIRSLIGDANYFVTDFENVFDPSPSASPLQTDDGLHPNCYGAYLIGNAWAQDTLSYFNGPSILPTTVTGENLCTNPLMSGTGGSGSGTGFSGVVSDDWHVTWVPTGTIACAASKDTLSTGQAAQSLAMSGTGSALFSFVSPTLTINGQVGDNFEAWCCAEWSGSGFLGVALQDTNSTVFNGGDNGSTAQDLFSPVNGVLRARPITLTGTQTTIVCRAIGTVSAGANATLKLGQFMVRKVPPGQ